MIACNAATTVSTPWPRTLGHSISHNHSRSQHQIGYHPGSGQYQLLIILNITPAYGFFLLIIISLQTDIYTRLIAISGIRNFLMTPEAVTHLIRRAIFIL